MKAHGEHHVRLDDGTCWAVDRGDPSLEWICRYGTIDRLHQARLTIASVLQCYKALLDLPQKERNRRVTELRSALASAWPSPAGSKGDEG